MKKTFGLTLIELLVAMAILAIIVGLGAPAFNAAVRNNRATTATNDLVMALQLARSEAVKRRQNVVVCRRNGTACQNGTDWAVGWLVQSGGNVIQVWDPPQGGAAVTGPAAGVTFQPDGLSSGAAVFSVVLPGCSGNEQRTVNVATTGRVNTTITACP